MRSWVPGFAVNAENDLAPFASIVPCGLAGVRMTSIAHETGRTGNLAGFRVHVGREFAIAHERRQRDVEPARLHSVVGATVG